MKKYIEGEPEPWAGLRRSLIRLIEVERTRRMSNTPRIKKSIHQICEMDPLDAWETSLKQLPKRKLEEHRYDSLVAVCNSPFTMTEYYDDAVKLLKMTALHFKERYEKKIGDQRQNATLWWLAGTNYERLMENIGL